MGKPAWLKRKAILAALGYDMTSWSRVVYYRECFDFLRGIKPETLDALEISGGDNWRSVIPFRSFTEAHYPDYDVCSGPLPGGKQFDVVIADQVWPHVLWPYRATRNVLEMLRPGGTFVCTVSFLIQRNNFCDCTRWTDTGLKHLMIEAGFPEDGILLSGSWGNRDAAIASLKRLGVKRGWFGSLENDPRYPLSSWVVARKPL